VYISSPPITVIILSVDDGNNDDKGCVSTENSRFRQKENTLTLNTNLFYPVLKKIKLFISVERFHAGTRLYPQSKYPEPL
jgi:hypothetical protein